MLCLALPARAAVEPWRYDLAVQRFLYGQSQAVAESGTVLEDWLSGRSSTPIALQELDQRQEAVQAWADKLVQAPVPAALKEYRQAVLARSQAHLQALGKLRRFVQAQKAQRKSIQAFAADLNQGLSAAQQAWLKQRGHWLPRLAVGAPGQVQAYYAWEKQILPLQIREAFLSGALQRLVYQGSDKEPDTQVLARDARALQSSLAALGQQAASLKVGPGPQKAHQAYQKELSSLQHVTQAVVLLAQDPSEDSMSRLRRSSRQLVQASRQAQEAALEALGSGK